MKAVLCGVVLTLALLSCEKKKITTQSSAGPAGGTTEKPAATFQQPPVYLDSATTEKQILEHLGKRKTEMEALLKTATPAAANELYEDYKKEDDSALYLLELRKGKLLEEYVNFMQYDEKTGENPVVIPKDRQAEVKNIENHDVQFWYVGEGYTTVRRPPDYYYNLFGSKVTADYQRFLEIFGEEDKVLYGADAGIIVPWKEIGKRILVREKFLKDFPESALVKKMKGQLKSYRWDYFAGEDNTPVFPGYEETENVMDEEIAKEYQRFMKANPHSETSKMLKELLKNPKQDIWKDNLTRMLGERYE